MESKSKLQLISIIKTIGDKDKIGINIPSHSENKRKLRIPQLGRQNNKAEAANKGRETLFLLCIKNQNITDMSMLQIAGTQINSTHTVPKKSHKSKE